MKGQIFESPRGPMFIDAQTRDVVHNIYIRKVEKVGNGQLYNQEFDVIKDVKDPGKTSNPPKCPPASPPPPQVGRRQCGGAAPGGRWPGQYLRRSPLKAGCFRHPSMLTILFDGIAYGMLLFILAVGLAVTMGLMNFINLAHGAFAMAGGYITVVLMQRHGVPFLACLPLAFVGAALLGGVLERTLYRRCTASRTWTRCCSRSAWLFMAVATADYFMGSQQQIMQLPEWLAGRTELGTGPSGMGHYRLFIIAVCAALTIGLQFILSKPASAAACAPAWTTRGWRRAWASTSTWCSCPPSLWARAWPVWAAPWVRKCWGWIRPFR
jgi:hypothetical protein